MVLRRLNPYSTGRYSLISQQPILMSKYRIVLILILLEDTL